MRWSFSTLTPADVKADALVVGVFDDLSFEPLAGAKTLQAQARQVKFKGGAGETFFAFEPYGKPKKHLLLVGTGNLTTM